MEPTALWQGPSAGGQGSVSFSELFPGELRVDMRWSGRSTQTVWFADGRAVAGSVELRKRAAELGGALRAIPGPKDGVYLEGDGKARPTIARGTKVMVRTADGTMVLGKVSRAVSDGRFSVQKVECLGSCGTAPMMQINDDGYYENVGPAKCSRILASLRNDLQPLPDNPVPVTVGADGRQVLATGQAIGSSVTGLHRLPEQPAGGDA